MDRFNCLKPTKPLNGDSLIFTTQSPGVPGTHLIDLRRMKGCGLPCNHPLVLNLGLLDWETSILTTTIIWKKYVKCKCPVFIHIKQTLHYKVAIIRIIANIIGEAFIFYVLLPISPLEKILQWLF